MSLSQNFRENGFFYRTYHLAKVSFKRPIFLANVSFTQPVLSPTRHNYYQGPLQIVNLEEGHVYNMEAWIKLLNDNGKSQHVQLEAAYILNNGRSDDYVKQTAKA